MDGAAVREHFTDAIKFWEPRRIIYNLVLAAIVVLYFAAGYPSSRAVLSIDFALSLFLLAVAANVAHCAAYIVDIFVRRQVSRDLATCTLGTICDRDHIAAISSFHCDGDVSSHLAMTWLLE
jgi:hypothetical protein